MNRKHIGMECRLQFHAKKGSLPRGESEKYVQRMIETLILSKEISQLLTKRVMEIIKDCVSLELYNQKIKIAINNLNVLENKEKETVINLLSSIPEEIGFDNDLPILLIDPIIHPNFKNYTENTKNGLPLNNENNEDSDNDIDFFIIQ